MLDLDPLAPRTPRLPHQRLGAPQLAASIALHVSLVVVAASDRDHAGTWHRVPPGRTGHRRTSAACRVSRARGAAGGRRRRWRRQSATGADPSRAGRRLGLDHPSSAKRAAATAAPVTAASAPAVEDVPPLPSIVLDAKPLASGLFDQIGLPAGGVMSGTSTGPGSGGGVGTGIGTGIGSGRGPGLGPGSGGGTGGGVYRPGGAVSGPRLINEVKPKYTSEALRNRIQGTVVLEAVVSGDGCTSQIRVVRSLDRGGLDEEAVAAVAQWRFEPGRLAGAPVDVLVTIMLDFSVR